mmetsp:Transcript_6333/g.16031  ORF Transcript_6333/g.16031 Transcript_6333/m.16031 type:complete len:87 (-) Transcript_6333:2568-2828(-)
MPFVAMSAVGLGGGLPEDGRECDGAARAADDGADEGADDAMEGEETLAALEAPARASEATAVVRAGFVSAGPALLKERESEGTGAA